MSALRMLIGMVIFCSLIISSDGMPACEEEQELLFHEDVEHDLDCVLDRLGFGRNTRAYCDIRTPHNDGNPPLQRAVLWGDVDATKQIVSHPLLKLTYSQRCQYIHRAMLNAAMFAGNMACVKTISRSPSLCLSETEQEAIFMRAHLFLIFLNLGFPEKSRVFFNINARDSETGDCVLVRAVLREDFDIVRALLSFEDLNLNCCNNYSTTALIQAIVCKTDDILKIILQDDRPRKLDPYYLDINCADCLGLTPLMWAIKVDNECAIDWLCADRRLDPTRTDKENRSALDWAYLMKNELAIQKLKVLMSTHSARSSGGQRARGSTPRTPQYETPHSPRSLTEIVPDSPRLSTLMPSLSAPQLPFQAVPSQSNEGMLRNSRRLRLSGVHSSTL